MNCMRMESDMPSITTPNIQKENSVQLTNSQIVKESAFKHVESVKESKEQCHTQNNGLADSRQTLQTNDELNPPNKAISEERISESSSNCTDSESIVGSEMLNDGSIKTFESLDAGNDDDSANFLVSCRFCRKGFETLEQFNAHNCKKGKNNASHKVHKCKFCSLTFSMKLHLTRHIKGHKRNNCTICNAQFTKRKALCKHLRIEHHIVEPETLYHCSFCSENFTSRRSKIIHLKTHVSDPYFCLKCGFSCDEEAVYNGHVKEHIKSSKYECKLCGKKFVRRQQHEQHMMGHERYSCTSCDLTFSTKKLFLKHQQSVHQTRIEKKHACPVCKKLFLRPKHLQVHQRIHTGEKPVKCSHCEKSFYDHTSLSRHMKTVRHLRRVNIDKGKDIEIEKPYLCSGCGARFYRQQSLFRHIEIIHSASESLKCPHCEYSTKCKTNLKRHIELHTDTKRFICEVCGASFRAFATLKEHHAFVHSENRGFICDVCNKGFKSKSTLQRHMRIHSENRPYKCHCNRDYKRMSHLKRHMISAHHMTFKKNQIPIIKDNSNSNENVSNGSIAALVESLEALSDHSSSDEFSTSSVSNNNVVFTELSNEDINENSEERLPALGEGDRNFTNVPSNTMQTLLDKNDANIMSDDSKSTLETSFVSTGIKIPPMCMLPDSHGSVSLDDPNLNLSTNNFCNFNLPSSPLGSLPIENVTLQHSIASQDVLSFSAADSLIRPHSLPNLNFQTPTSSIDSFAHFSIQNSNSPTSLEIPSFLLTGDISSPSHVTDLNLEGNNSPKQLFGDSDDILSLTPYPSSNELGETNCSSEHFFNPSRDVELWSTSDNSNRLKLPDSDLVTTNTCANTNFSNMTANANNLLPHNLMFSNDSLMVCSLDAAALNSEFEALSNLC